MLRHGSIFGLYRNGWPISLEVGNANSTSKFMFPTAEAMGRPTRRFNGVGAQERRLGTKYV